MKRFGWGAAPTVGASIDLKATYESTQEQAAAAQAAHLSRRNSPSPYTPAMLATTDTAVMRGRAMTYDSTPAAGQCEGGATEQGGWAGCSSVKGSALC